MKSRRTRDFKDAFARLPKAIQAKAIRAFHYFRTNPQHPSLQFKLIDRENEVYSARIGPHYRALAAREPDAWVWFWIGPHSEYDELIAHL
jgi:hypothetical protein